MPSPFCGKALRVVDETLQIVHQGHDLGRLLRGCIDDFLTAVFQCGAWQLAKSGTILFQFGLNGEDMVVGDQAGLLHQFKTKPQSLPVTQHLFGCRIEMLIRQHRILEQFVVGGDDVFDFGTLLGLFEPQGADQDALIGLEDASPLSSASCRLLLANFFKISGVSKRAGCRSLREGNGFMTPPCAETTCIENRFFYTCYPCHV